MTPSPNIVRSEEDKEIAAMRLFAELFPNLSRKARRRVLQWLVDKYTPQVIVEGQRPEE